MSPTIESEVETKYEIHEYIDIQEIKEEPADYQQSQIKIENLALGEYPNDVPENQVSDDIYSSEDYSDVENLDHSQIKCCEYECDEVTEINSQLMVIRNGDFEYSIYKKDPSSNSISHMKTQNNKKLKQKKIHKCQYCEYGNPRMSNLKCHIKCKHKVEVTPLSLLQLWKPSNVSFKNHINSIHTREKMPKCEYCDYGSPDISNLKSHIKCKHSREKLHNCEYCDYGSPWISILKSHINSVHTKEKIHNVSIVIMEVLGCHL